MLLHCVTLIIGIIPSQYNYDNLQYTIIWEENIRFSNEYSIYMSSRNYSQVWVWFGSIHHLLRNLLPINTLGAWLFFAPITNPKCTQYAHLISIWQIRKETDWVPWRSGLIKRRRKITMQTPTYPKCVCHTLKLE